MRCYSSERDDQPERRDRNILNSNFFFVAISEEIFIENGILVGDENLSGVWSSGISLLPPNARNDLFYAAGKLQACPKCHDPRWHVFAYGVVVVWIGHVHHGEMKFLLERSQ